MMIRRLLAAAKMLRWRDVGATRGPCAACGFPLLVRLRQSEIGVRCPRCGASAITLSLVDVLRRTHPALHAVCAYELSAAGPLVRYLRTTVGTLVTSELFDGQTPGSTVAGIECQDVQALTYSDNRFDLCTSTEVFEHVEDDIAGFRELFRVLRPGGLLVFTVPLTDQPQTVERTAWVQGQRINVLPPAYHADRYRGCRVFAYRDYGLDIVARLESVGFIDAHIALPTHRLFGYARPVLVAKKPD